VKMHIINIFLTNCAEKEKIPKKNLIHSSYACPK